MRNEIVASGKVLDSRASRVRRACTGTMSAPAVSLLDGAGRRGETLDRCRHGRLSVGMIAEELGLEACEPFDGQLVRAERLGPSRDIRHFRSCHHYRLGSGR